MVLDNRLKRILQTIIEIALIIFLINYFYEHRNELYRISQISINDALALTLIVLIGNIFRSLQLKQLIKILGAKISYSNSIWLTVGSTLLNYLPMNLGMIVKARGIKKSLGIKYAYFVSLTSIDILFIMVSGSIMAFITLAIESLFEGGKGTDIVGVRGSYWGAYNAVTEYLSYSKGRTSNNRMDSLWFGVNGNLNSKALDTALQMAS